MMERTGQERRRGRERLGSSEGEQRRGGLKVQCATFIYEIFLVQWKHTLSKYTSSVKRTVTLSVLSLEETFTLEAAILGQPCFFWPFWKNHYGPFEIIIKQWQTTLCWHWLPCSYWFSVRQVSCPICLFVSNHFCPVCGQLFSQCLCCCCCWFFMTFFFKVLFSFLPVFATLWSGFVAPWSVASPSGDLVFAFWSVLF